MEAMQHAVRFNAFLALRAEHAQAWSRTVNHQVGQLTGSVQRKPRLTFFIQLARSIGLEPCYRCGVGFNLIHGHIPDHVCEEELN